MKSWLIAVVVTVCFGHAFPEQTNKPKPNHGDAKEVVSQPSKPVPESPAIQPAPTAKQSSTNSEAEQTGWGERLASPVISNWPLLAVAIWGILVAKGTLEAIKRHADLAAIQIGHLVNTERAWIMPELKWSDVTRLIIGSDSGGGKNTLATVDLFWATAIRQLGLLSLRYASR